MKTLVKRGACRGCGTCCRLSNCKEINLETLKCRLHDFCWPPICRAYPVHPCFMFTRYCGFAFYDKDTGEKIDNLDIRASYYPVVEDEDGKTIFKL